MTCQVLAAVCPQCRRPFAMSHAQATERAPDVPDLFHVPKDAWIGFAPNALPDHLTVLVLCSTQCMKDYCEGSPAQAN